MQSLLWGEESTLGLGEAMAAEHCECTDCHSTVGFHNPAPHPNLWITRLSGQVPAGHVTSCEPKASHSPSSYIRLYLGLEDNGRGHALRTLLSGHQIRPLKGTEPQGSEVTCLRPETHKQLSPGWNPSCLKRQQGCTEEGAGLDTEVGAELGTEG